MSVKGGVKWMGHWKAGINCESAGNPRGMFTLVTQSEHSLIYYRNIGLQDLLQELEDTHQMHFIVECCYLRSCS